MKRPKKHRQKTTPALAFLQQCIAPHRKTLTAAMALDGLAVIIFILQMSFLAKTVVALTQSSWEAYAMIGLVLCFLLRPLCQFWRERMLSKVGWQIARQTKQSALASLGVHGLARERFGADGFLVNKVSHESEALQGYARFYVQKITAVLAPVLIAIAVASHSLTATLVLLLTAPLAPIFMILIGLKTAQKSREQMDALGELSGRFLDWLRGSATLRALLATKSAAVDIEQAAQAYKTRTMDVLKIAFLNNAVLEFLSALSIALVAVYLGFGLLGELPFYKGKMLSSHETALFILLVVPEFYAPLKRLGADYHIKSQALAAATALAPLMTTTPLAHHKPRAGDVVLNQVSVQEEGRIRLPPVSLHIQQGQRWVVTGKSGSGKSTLLAVLAGFSAYEGKASIAGVHISKMDKTALWAMMGYLPQTHALLPLSIADNLRLAKPSATEQELQAVLRQVGLSQLVAALPMGVDTVLCERGGGLSGGQAQRLAIAQLILQNADIWLLDEPTEHLDEETKQAIHQLIYELSTDKTLIWVTHDRPVAWADGVCHLEAYE